MIRSAWDPMNRPVQEPVETLVAQVKRRDWGEIIATLNAAGYSLRSLGRLVHKSDVAVRYWRDDPRAEPKDSDARILMVLYRKVTGGQT